MVESQFVKKQEVRVMGKVKIHVGYLETMIAALNTLQSNRYLDEVKFLNIRVGRETEYTEGNMPKQKIVIEEIEE